MSLTVFLAVLGAALLHASWNAIVRGGASKVTTILVLTVVQGVLGALIALFRGFPPVETLGWLLASGVFHAGYKAFLAYAYEHGDLSRVYPIARGAAPLLVLLVSLVFMAEGLEAGDVLAVLILGMGILLMGRGAFLAGESRRVVPLALASAAMTAGYSLVDGIGARLSGDALGFVAWIFILDAVLLTPLFLVMRGPRVLQASRSVWVHGSAAAALSFGAYVVVVWAMTLAPIALVTALRETSILFAVLIGWLIFGERMDRIKAVAAGLILVGVAMTRL